MLGNIWSRAYGKLSPRNIAAVKHSIDQIMKTQIACFDKIF